MNKKAIYNKEYESNCYGTMEVLSVDSKKMRVRFKNTGYETTAHTANVIAGKVRDKSVPRNNTITEWSDCNIPIVVNSGSSLRIIAKKAHYCIVQFDNTGTTIKALYANVVAGKIKDPYEKTFLGIGYLGIFKKHSYWKQAKQLWSNMMKRCYNKNDSRGYYGRAFVDSRWQCFANFLEDIPSLDNFDKWLLGFNPEFEKYNLDKDLKIKGNKVYSKKHVGLKRNLKTNLRVV